MSDLDKFHNHIKPHIEGKSVLDIGAVQHDASKSANEGWMHGLIREHAASTMGIDYLESEVEKLQERGYNIVAADAQDFSLKETFDVVFLGELIEHLTDFDGLLQSVEDHLAEDGRLIVTTPNSISPYWSWARLLGVDVVNPEHTCWFDRETLAQLLGRYGFEIQTVEYAKMSRLKYVRSPLDAGGWLLETVLPKAIGRRNMILVAKRQ